MIRQGFACTLCLVVLLRGAAFAQDEDLRSRVDYKINKVTKELNLTQVQADALRPIIKDYLMKRSAILQETATQGIIDHTAVKSTLKRLKDDEHQQLSHVLSEDQLKQWINKENVMAALNPDSAESSMDEDVGLNANGANFKF